MWTLALPPVDRVAALLPPEEETLKIPALAYFPSLGITVNAEESLMPLLLQIRYL